jgi:hypothetical protein
MNEDTQTLAAQAAEYNAGDEMSVLKQRARLMGIVFSNNIGIEALKAKITVKQSEDEVSYSEAVALPNPLIGETQETLIAKPRTLRQAQMEDEMKLIRLRITNMDPKKKELPGEILTFANEVIGTVCKYVPYGEVTDEGYHVPHCLYTILKNRKFLNIRVTKTPNGQSKVSQSWAQEFSLEVLPPLTKADLMRLGTAQMAAGVIVPNSESF